MLPPELCGGAGSEFRYGSNGDAVTVQALPNRGARTARKVREDQAGQGKRKEQAMKFEKVEITTQTILAVICLLWLLLGGRGESLAVALLAYMGR